MPFSSASSVTLVPGFQYVRGRQSTRSRPDQSRSQPQEPSVPFEVVTLSCFSTSARFLTGWSKTREIGWAMPTVVAPPGRQSTLLTFVAGRW